MESIGFGWFTEPPLDLEYKRYKLLAQVTRLEKSIEATEVDSALDFIEENLGNLYKFIHYKGEIDSRRKVLKGIDFQNMRLVYEMPETEPEIMVLEEFAKIAIDEFERVYRLCREMWREVETRISLSYVPEKPFQLSSGVIIIPYKEKFKVYEFDYPAYFDGDWRTFKTNFLYDKKLEESEISKIIDYAKNSLGHNIVVRISRGLDNFHFHEAVLPIVKQKVFLDLKRNYFF